MTDANADVSMTGPEHPSVFSIVASTVSSLLQHSDAFMSVHDRATSMRDDAKKHARDMRAQTEEIFSSVEACKLIYLGDSDERQKFVDHAMSILDSVPGNGASSACKKKLCQFFELNTDTELDNDAKSEKWQKMFSKTNFMLLGPTLLRVILTPLHETVLQLNAIIDCNDIKLVRGIGGDVCSGPSSSRIQHLPGTRGLIDELSSHNDPEAPFNNLGDDDFDTPSDGVLEEDEGAACSFGADSDFNVGGDDGGTFTASDF